MDFNSFKNNDSSGGDGRKRGGSNGRGSRGGGWRGRGNWRGGNKQWSNKRTWNNFNNNKTNHTSASPNNNYPSLSNDDSDFSSLPIAHKNNNDDNCFIDLTFNPNCPYKNWNLYFPRERYKEDSFADRNIKVFMKYIKKNENIFDLKEITQKCFFVVDYKHLCSDQNIGRDIIEFHNEFTEKPQVYIDCLSLAMNQIAHEEHQKFIEKMLSDDDDNSFTVEDLQTATKDVPHIQARIINYSPFTKIKQLKANFYEKFISFTGTVVRVGNQKPFCKVHCFECQNCNVKFQMSLTNGKYSYPTRCGNKNCRGKTFCALSRDPLTQIVNWQRIRVQETFLVDKNDDENGRIPRSIECELTDDLTGTCLPGDLVTICGIVKALTVDTTNGTSGSTRDKCTFVLYINANSIVNNKTQSESISGDNINMKKCDKLDFSVRDLEAFKEIQAEPDVYKSIVNSICPSIFGHEIVKAGLVLGLFGGTQRQDSLSTRSDPHVLVVGDPGLGKSQLLQACANVSPRGVYVCGHTTTAAGLTVTLSKDSGDDYAFEAGALLCAHNGTCCIDEFDKMGQQQQTLLEVMEQQTISIAKGGIVCSLPAKATVLAAANPVGGHYDKSKTVSENLKLSGPLLSRFDLLFILLDKPDEEYDFKLSSHIISLHLNQSKDLNHSRTSSSMNSSNMSRALDETTLGERLKNFDPDFDAIPAILLRKYISYARQNCHPKLSEAAATVLRDFYLTLRKTYKKPHCNPITMRQLESLMRLTQARAKVELRKECTKQDALDVVEIMKVSMVDYYTDETGDLDFSRSMNGSGSSKSSMVKKFVAHLQSVSDKRKNNIFSYDDIHQEAQKVKLNCKNFGEFIGLLNTQNFILKKGPKLYQLMSSNY